MAPRTAKTKKIADVKVAEIEVPKKGRGKAKQIEEMESLSEEISEMNEVAPSVEKKAKRGKKAVNGSSEQETNGNVNAVPPAKKGRRKNVDEPVTENMEVVNVDDSPVENSDVDYEADTDGHSKEIKTASAGRGRKKQPKKENKLEASQEKETGKGKNNTKHAKNELQENEETSGQIAKATGKGRGRKPKAKPEKYSETEEKIDENEEAKVEEVKASITKGKKKAQGKAAKEKTPENDNKDTQDELKEEEETVVEPQKKETKGRKKKTELTENVEEELNEEAPASKKRKVTKKEEKGKGDLKDEDIAETEPKPAKGRRGQKKLPEKTVESDEELQDTGEPTSKRRRKPAEEKASMENPKKKASPKNKALTDYESIDFSNFSKNEEGKEWNFKISSWNVDGIRAWLSKGGLDYIKYEKPHILCLQETKCSQDKLPEEIANLPGYHAYWLGSDKDGYAGVGIYTTKLAINVQYGLENEELDADGRIITAEYEQFYLICTYVPNAGRKLVTLPKRLEWNQKFRNYVKELDKKKPVIICGDMNVAHNEIDLTNPKTNKKNAGFTAEERAGMTELLGDGFVDTYRKLYPDQTGAYTFWTYMMNSRAKNVGWRLDYFIISERLVPSMCDSVIRSEVYGSDHCPIALFLHLTTADKPKE